ncbi:hypothetical protein ACWGIR_30820 [Streptomyces albidoflavus]
MNVRLTATALIDTARNYEVVATIATNGAASTYTSPISGERAAAYITEALADSAFRVEAADGLVSAVTRTADGTTMFFTYRPI